MDTNKLKVQVLGAAMLLLWGATALRAAPITFVESGMSGAAPSAAFSMVGGQLHITVSSDTGVVAPSASLTGVSWTMGATPVLAVSQVQAPASTFSAASGQATGQFGFKAGVSVDPNLFKSFGSYSSKGVAGAAMVPTEQGMPSMSLATLSATVQAHPIMLTLPTGYVVVNTVHQTYQYGIPVAGGTTATAIREAGFQVGTPAIGVAVPLPMAVWPGLSTLVGMGLLGAYRRHRSA